MAYRKFTVGAYSSRYTTDWGYLVMPSNHVPSGASRVIIGCHGRGGNALTFGVGPVDIPVNALVDAGYVVLGVDHARINSWGDADSMRALDDAYAYLATLGMTNTKVGLLAWSMGGIVGLNWLKRNPQKVACMWAWNPATNLRYYRDAAGAYTPTYGLGGAAASQGAYTTEINGNFAPTTTAVGTYTIPALGGVGITITHAALTIGNMFADANNSAQVGLPYATTGGVDFTYTSKTDTSLIGCVSTTASTIAVANAQAITGAYAGQTKATDPWVEAAFIGGLGIPIRIAQASDDTTVPPEQNIHASAGFVARAANPNVTLRGPNPIGGHVMGIPNVPSSELVSFYKASL